MPKKHGPTKKYARISLQKRRKLIALVKEVGKSLVQAAKELKINLSTAKLIYKKYDQTGKFFDKKMPDFNRRKKKVVKL